MSSQNTNKSESGSFLIQQPVGEEVRDNAFTIVRAGQFQLNPHLRTSLEELRNEWNDLELDQYMKDGGSYRERRYGRFSCIPNEGKIESLPHSAFFQDQAINDFAGGIERWFAEISDTTRKNEFLHELLRYNLKELPLSESERAAPWEIAIHQFRVKARAGEEGKPSPEGIHQDGHTYVTIHLMNRDNVEGGQTVIYDEQGVNLLQKLTLKDTLDSFYLDDGRVMHGVVPISPVDSEQLAIRDILVVDYNKIP